MRSWQRYFPTGVGATVLLIAGAWLAPKVGPLAELAPATKHMLGTTKEILAETTALHSAVGDIQANLAQVQRQEMLLEEQEELIIALLEQLAAQERTAESAKEGLEVLLATERHSVDLANRANRAGQATLVTLSANAEELTKLERATDRIDTSGRELERQTNGLLAEMELATESFAVLGRLKQGASQTVERSQGLWDRVKGWLGF